MNQAQNKTKLPASNPRRRSLKAATILTLLTACAFAAGCANQAKDTAPATAASGTTAAPTPEQEAAKQRGIQTGEAMQAREDAAKKAAGGQ